MIPVESVAHRCSPNVRAALLILFTVSWVFGRHADGYPSGLHHGRAALRAVLPPRSLWFDPRHRDT